MKKCAYCGRENAMDAEYCCECGTKEFRVPNPSVSPTQQEIERVREPFEPESDVATDAEAALCTSCLFPNLPDSRWCKRCGAPMSTLVFSLMPDAAQAAGFVYRQAMEARPKLVVVVVIWVHFFPGFIFSTMLLWSILATNMRGLPEFVWFLLSILGIVICSSMLFRVTRNYFMMQIAKPNEGTA